MGRVLIALRCAAGLAVLALAACSGGGGSAPPVPAASSGAASNPSPSATGLVAPAATASTAGAVYDLPYDGTAANPGYSVLANGNAAAPGAPIANADVYVGPTLVLGASAPAATPTNTMHAVTAANGSFSLAGLTPGVYALTIFAPAPHTAVVHRVVTVAAGSPVGTYLMTAPTPAENAWLAQQSADRSAFGVSPMSLDEAALEAGRYWASFMARNGYFSHCIPASLCEAGDTTPPPPSYASQDVDPAHRIAYFHGFGATTEGENIAAGFATWQSVDTAFMSEQKLCPGDSPANCSFTNATGHFLNIVDAQYAWTGVAIATGSNGAPFYDEEFTFVSTTRPTTSIRK